MTDDPPPLEVDIPMVMESILSDAGRPLSLDEWGFTVAALRQGATVIIKEGTIGFSFNPIMD